MKLPQRRALAIAIAALSSTTAFAADDAQTPASADVSTSGAPVRIAQSRSAATDASSPAAVQELDPIQVTGKRLDAARNQLSPETGSTIYRFDQRDIQTLPFGAETPLNQLLLQAPGVVQDSYGQLHVRGDHSNLQYRINGVVIPEAISGFGQALDTRFASQINVLTGALPAQYGYRTAGVVDIRTQGAGLQTGGSVSGLGGTRGHGEGSAEYGGSYDGWTYFVTGSFLRDNVGIENPTSDRDAIHDTTKQQKGFGYLSRIIDANSRVSFIVGSSNNKFEIPNVPGQSPAFAIDGDPNVDSSQFNARQNEKNSFQVATYQASPTDRIDYQLSVFHRYTDVSYQPDPLGDLLFNGVGAQVVRKNTAYGLQGDFGFRLNDQHTLRTGVFAQRERFTVDNASTVFSADDDGNQTSTTPFVINDNSKVTGVTYGVYLQDEWHPIDALTINFGARFDHVSTVVNEKQLSPRFGLTYDVTRDTRLHFGYSRYFTPPPTEKIDTTSVAKFLGTTNALPSDADTSVKSERSNYFDIGLSHQLTPEITVGVDAYYRKVKNLQDEGQFGNALIFSAFNFDQGRIRGVEFSAAYRKNNLSLYANASVSKAEGKEVVTGQFNFDPDELAFIASHWVHLDHDQKLTGSAGASYQWGATRVAADLLYGSGLRSGFANSEHLPSYTQVNLSATQTLQTEMLGKFEGRLAIINLFDRSFELRDGTGIGVGAPQFGPRRGFYGGVTKFF
jgi:outer membrane receptor protein involved in Fe transport